MAKPTLDEYFAQKEHAEKGIGDANSINVIDEDVLRDNIINELAEPVENIQQIGSRKIDKNMLIQDLNQLMLKYGYDPYNAAENQIIATFISNLYSI